MNYKAIDAGVEALVKINVPESWKTLDVKETEHKIEGNRPELVKFVKEIVYAGCSNAGRLTSRFRF